MAGSFNLPAPAGFRGLQPDLPIWRYQRHLPHWRQTGATYFVTFRLADSIPQTQLLALRRWRANWEREHPEPRSEADWEHLAREITSQTERYLDEGYGECLLGTPKGLSLISDSLLKFQGTQYFTSCFVVMPNHVHLVIQPFEGFELETILKNAKGYVARQLNHQFGREGTVWAEESYDRIVRDEEHLWRVIQYLGRNPEMAGLNAERYVLWLHPAWRDAGWGFRAG